MKESHRFCDHSGNHPHIFIHTFQQKFVFNDLHYLSHPGIKTSTKLIKSRFYGPNMNCEIQKQSHECLNWQQSKINRHVKLTPYPLNSHHVDRLETISLDIFGTSIPVTIHIFNSQNQFKNLKTSIDITWIEATLLTDKIIKF